MKLVFPDAKIPAPKKACCELAEMFNVVCLDCHKPKRNSAGKNLMGKMRSELSPYEIWEADGWKWVVLKKWQADDHKLNARWFCKVYSPVCPEGELGDCYAADIMNQARKTFPFA